MIQPYIRASFAIGYSEYAEELTEEAAACCLWLMERGEADTGEAMIEMARNLGRFQSVRATTRMRRDALFTKFLHRQRPLFQAISRSPRTVAKIVRTKAPHEAETNLDILKALKDNIDPDEWRILLNDAWIEAKAEGNVDAMAYIAVAQNMPTISMDQQFPQAVDALRGLQFADANAWIDKQLNGLAYSVGNDLADAIAAGKSYEELLSIVAASIAIGGDAPLMLDTMLSTGVSAGSIDQYQQEGVDMVDILTSAVDDECSDAADNNPWTTDEADGMVPFHPNCRCAVAPHFD